MTQTNWIHMLFRCNSSYRNDHPIPFSIAFLSTIFTTMSFQSLSTIVNAQFDGYHIYGLIQWNGPNFFVSTLFDKYPLFVSLQDILIKLDSFVHVWARIHLNWRWTAVTLHVNQIPRLRFPLTGVILLCVQTCIQPSPFLLPFSHSTTQPQLMEWMLFHQVLWMVIVFCTPKPTICRFLIPLRCLLSRYPRLLNSVWSTSECWFLAQWREGAFIIFHSQRSCGWCSLFVDRPFDW